MTVLFLPCSGIYLCVMDVFKAIEEMRRLSALRESFSFSYMSYSHTRRKSDGIVTVRRARLCKPVCRLHAGLYRPGHRRAAQVLATAATDV